MDVKSYCDTLENQLTSWKANISDVVRIVDELPDVEKESVFSSIRSLQSVVGEIDGHLEHLMSACPEDWISKRRTIDSKMNELKQTLQNLSEQVSGPLIPDSLSWVSE